MKYYTSDDYDSLVRYTYKEISELNDVSENYKLNNTKDKHHKHDKLFRKILNDKNEVAKLINMELEPEKELKEKDLEQYETKYIINKYEERVADVVYKLKDEEIFFLIEHQTKVDRNMMFRILEYTVGIIRSRKIARGKEVKVRVIPIVIYAGIQKWRTEIAFEDMQPEFRHKKGSSSIFKYNLVDIRDVDEAVKVGTAIARISVIERLNSTEEIIETIKKFAKVMKDKNERQELAEEIKYLLSDRLTKEEIENIEEILIEREGEDAMLHAQMVIRRDFERAKEEGRKEGMLQAQEVRRRDVEKAKEEGRREGMLHAQEVIRRDFEKAKEEGRKEGMLHAQEVIRRDFEKAKQEERREGKKEGIIQVAKKMLAEKMDVNLISKLTGLRKEQFMQ